MSDNANQLNIGKNVNGYRATILIACIMLLASALYMMILKEINDVVVIVVFVSVLTLAANFFVYIGMEDERARKIGTTAATYSWYITLVTMGFFLFSGYYAGRVFSAAEMFGLFTLLLVGSWMVVNAYLNLKGDVE